MQKVSGIEKISFWSNKLHLSHRDPPIAPDGLYDWQAGEDVDDSPEADSFLTNIFREVGTVIKKNRNAPHPRHVVRRIPFAFRLHLTT
jgi:linoleate 10R-lipoxygenase